MSYPPPHYGYPQQPPAGYRPPPGYPPAGYPPPQQPQWSPGGYQAPQGPPPGYQAPQGYPPEQAPSPTPPKKQGGGCRKTVRVIGYGLGAVILVWAGLAVFLGDDPKQGDCLSSMDENWLASLDVVECDSPEAAYEVVEYDDNGSTTVCSGHDDGEMHQATGRRGKVYWSLCAVPK